MYSGSGRGLAEKLVDDRRIVAEVGHEMLDLVAELGSDQIEWKVARLPTKGLLDLGRDALCAAVSETAQVPQTRRCPEG